MGSLDNTAFTALVDRGCLGCGGKKLAIRSYVEGSFPLSEGESDGTVFWVYKGETFVDGVFEIRCAACKKTLFTESQCPRCHAADALDGALETENRRPPPAACPRCHEDSLVVRAFAPVDVVYQGKRPEKARTSYHLDDQGFHVARLDCTTCGTIEPAGDGCPLCAAEGPIRPQPT
jgi:hypothetical protein